ncbi:MAG: HD domain-containing protein [Clostridia bacterium]
MNLINELYLRMIEFNSCDPKRIQHFTKVHSYAKLIAECENIGTDTQFILEAAALTHDIGIRPAEKEFGRCDGKLQEQIGPAYAEKMLSDLNFDKSVIERVSYLIAHHHTYSNVDGIDYQILIEADFIVNLFEANMAKGTIIKTIENIFKTKTGISICKTMFL